MEAIPKIDINNPKIKHLTGLYLKSDSCPTPEDVLYWALSKNKKNFNLKEASTFFIDKDKQLAESLSKLEAFNLIEKQEDNYKVTYE